MDAEYRNGVVLSIYSGTLTHVETLSCWEYKIYFTGYEGKTTGETKKRQGV
jgi:hypothetical protein